MGYICHKFFLIIFRAGNLACHIVQAGGKIADFVVTFYLKFIMHVSVGILFRCVGNFPQRYIDNFRKKNQND